MANITRDFLPGRNRMVLNNATVMKAIEEYLNRRITQVSNNIKVVEIDGENSMGAEVSIYGVIIQVEPIDLAE